MLVRPRLAETICWCALAEWFDRPLPRDPLARARRCL